MRLSTNTVHPLSKERSVSRVLARISPNLPRPKSTRGGSGEAPDSA